MNEPESMLRDELAALAATTVVRDGWDDLVADLDRVVTIAPPSRPRRAVLAAASVAAAIAVVGVLVVTVRARDDGAATEPAPRYFSFVHGRAQSVQVAESDQPTSVVRYASDDGTSALTLLTAPGADTASGRTTIDVGGVAVGVVVNGEVRGAVWTEGGTTSVAQLFGPTAIDEEQAVAVLGALDGLALPQAGCPTADPLCAPPDALAALPAGDPFVALLRALPALVRAADIGKAPPPPGFRDDPLLAAHRTGTVDGDAAVLTFWRTDLDDVSTADLRRLAGLQRLGPIVEGPADVSVAGRPAVTVGTSTQVAGAVGQRAVLWSPAPGWVAVVQLAYGDQRPAASADDVLALAADVGEVTEAQWAALPRS